MTKKRWTLVLIVFVALFFVSIFYQNITTYYSIKKHTGYTYGIIVRVWDDKGTWYSRYQYTVNGVTFQGRQGDKRNLIDTVLIVYDTAKPRFSMIATFPLNIVVDSNNKLIQLDTSRVSYKWSDYLPGDEIRSIRDLWSLD